MNANMNKGLSLIELLISVSIVSLLAAAGSISLAKYQKTVQLGAAASLMEVSISRAKTMAQSPPSANQDYSFFGIIIDKNANDKNADQYMLAARKGDDGKIGSDQKILEVFELKNGISFGAISGIPNVNSVADGPMFGVEEQGKIVNLTGDIEIQITDGSETQMIKIDYPYGVVSQTKL